MATIGALIAAGAEAIAAGAAGPPTGDPDLELIHPPPQNQAGVTTAWGAVQAFFGQTAPWQVGVYQGAVQMIGGAG